MKMKQLFIAALLLLIPVAANAGLSGGTAASAGAAITPSTVAASGAITTTATGDKVISATNGGHISDPIGSASLPTVGTGTVTAGGTDTAMIVTGATSPVTVTFASAFAVAPVCVCSNISTAAHGCAVSSPGTGSVVVTTAGTDSFGLICIGK